MEPNKRSLKSLADDIQPINEDEQGKLLGGFASFSVESPDNVPPTNSNANNVSSCHCTCNTVAGCGTK